MVIITTATATSTTNGSLYELQHGAVFIYEGNLYMTDYSWTRVFEINISNFDQALNTITNHLHQIDILRPTSNTTNTRTRISIESQQTSKNLVLARVYKLLKEIEELEDSIESYTEPR